jgi:type II secretory pathway predicted ATPase ExeA
MYTEFFGLRELPFELTANPRFLFPTRTHREALTTVQYGISARKGLILIAGEAGTGKTTVVRAALESLQGRRVESSYLDNPTLTRAEFSRFLVNEIGLSPAAAGCKVTLLAELQALLLEREAAGVTTALVIDEAQSLPHDLLEEIRLLANMETTSGKLLQVLLVGQPELAMRLEETSLRQLRQRVTLRAVLTPLDLAETAALVASRLKVAGGEPLRIFTADAVSAVYQHARGIPRVVHVICDNAMLTAASIGRRPVDAALIRDTCSALGVAPPTESPLHRDGEIARAAVPEYNKPKTSWLDGLKAGRRLPLMDRS